jgi:hypothetical protein
MNSTTAEAQARTDLIVENLVPAMRLMAMLDFRLASAAEAAAKQNDAEDETLELLAESAREHLRDALRDVRRMRLVLEMQENQEQERSEQEYGEDHDQ